MMGLLTQRTAKGNTTLLEGKKKQKTNSSKKKPTENESSLGDK